MPKTERFTFLTDPGGSREIEKLAELTQRTKSDAIRWAIREKARELETLKAKGAKREQEPANVSA